MYLKHNYNGECVLCNNKTVKEYKLWKEVKNDYPYDKVFKEQTLLTTKRHIAKINELTLNEIAELHNIMQLNNYDMLVYNSIKKQSQKQHFHFHLGKLK